MNNVYYVKLGVQNRVLKSRVYPNATSDAIQAPPPDMIDITDQIKNEESFAKMSAKVLEKPHKDLYFINGKFYAIDRYSLEDSIKLEKLLAGESIKDDSTE
jgi:hypothetical protein